MLLALQNQTPKKVTGGILTVALCVVSLGFITLWSFEGGASTEASGTLHSIRSALSTVVTPFGQASSVLGQATDSVGTAVSDATANPETLSELRAQNEELTAMVMELEEYRLENVRLSELLGLVEVYDLDAAAAHIIRTSIDSWNRTITIDRGTNDGMAVGMPVMSPNGLIGQIESAGPTTSEVRLLTDPTSGVSVVIQSNRYEGIVTGSLSGLLYLDHIPLDVKVIPGDVVITSGAGGVYPKGIVIGEITSVNYLPSDVYQTIVIKPTAKVKYYEEVLVLVGRPTEVTYSAPQNTGENAANGSGASDESSSSGSGESASGQGNQGSAAGASGSGSSGA